MAPRTLLRPAWLCSALLAAIAAPPQLATASQITSGSTDQCINVPWHGAPVEGTPVHIKQCDPWKNQQWALTAGQITGVGGLCLDVRGGQPKDGTAVVYASCNGSPAQNWRWANGQIIGIGGKCLDIAGAAPANGALLVITACSNSPTQLWVVH